MSRGSWSGVACHSYAHIVPHNSHVLKTLTKLIIDYNRTDVTGSDKKTFKESTLITGYFLATLGRGVLHGHDQNVGESETTELWKLKCVDFIALQAAFLRLYMDSFGKMYNKQLETYIPMSFPPSFDVYAKKEWTHLAPKFEPVYTSLRNWMFHEASSLIDFGPYRPLVAEPEVRLAVKDKRRILIDVGANGFFASPKYLLDSYSLYSSFTHAIMIEPEPHFSASVPKIYSEKYNITFLQIYAEVGTESATDILKLLPTLVTKDDFVVLKFDVDPNRYTVHCLNHFMAFVYCLQFPLTTTNDIVVYENNTIPDMPKDRRWSGASCLCL